MFYAENLLRNEYFPAELPPCFGSDDLADNYQDIINHAKSFNKPFSIPTIYSGYKSETSRRKFAVPNAYHYCRAVDCIVTNSTNIFTILKKSKYSLSAPQKSKPQKEEPYHKKSANVSDSKSEIEKQYQDNMYEIRLDINSFFDNIYTHSIPWAILGKSASKKDTSDALWGNVLDKSIRSMNYNQTNGILVGNALSRIISEIILCLIDDKLQTKFPEITCRRFVDDYSIYTKDSNLIKPIIAFVRKNLGEFELVLNENKLQINDSPFIYGKPWVEQIKQYIHLSPEVFLTKIVIEYSRYKDISILRYGLKVILLHKYSSKEWPEIQSKLINLWVRFPSLSDYITIIFKQNESKLQKQKITGALYTILDNCCQLGQEQEMIWAVWFIKVFELNISQKYIRQILKSENSLAIIIMLDIIKSKALDNNSTINKYLDELYIDLQIEDFDDKGNSNNMMWSKVWLSAYEIDLNKWLDKGTTRKFEYARQNQFYKELIKKNIRFYNSNFTYNLSEPHKGTQQYVTRKEVYALLVQLQKSINDNIKNSGTTTKTSKISFTLDEDKLFEKLNTLIKSDTYG